MCGISINQSMMDKRIHVLEKIITLCFTLLCCCKKKLGTHFACNEIIQENIRCKIFEFLTMWSKMKWHCAFYSKEIHFCIIKDYIISFSDIYLQYNILVQGSDSCIYRMVSCCELFALWQVNFGNIGDILKIRLEHDNKNPSPAWHVDWVRTAYLQTRKVLLEIPAIYEGCPRKSCTSGIFLIVLCIKCEI